MKPQDTQDALNLLDIAKDALACHCFRLMLSQGMTWEEIFLSLTTRIQYEEEAMVHLQKAASMLKLTAEDFPERLAVRSVRIVECSANDCDP